MQEERAVRQMTEADLRYKLHNRRRNAQQQPGSAGPIQIAEGRMKCYNCNQEGHHQADCMNDPYCFNCRNTGHKSTTCPRKTGESKPLGGLRLCGYGLPGQLFYALDVPEPKEGNKQSTDKPIRAMISVLEGRAMKLRVTTELRYLVDSEWNWDVKRLSNSEFLATMLSRTVLKMLANLKKRRFMTSDIVAVVEETDYDADVFQELQTVWIKAKGIPGNARTEFAVLELARLVGDPVEVHIPSLQWKFVWIKVSCKYPSQIGGSSEVFFNEKGKRIHWFYSDKMPQHPPNKPDDEDWADSDEEVTDEEDPASQESQGWQDRGHEQPSL